MIHTQFENHRNGFKGAEVIFISKVLIGFCRTFAQGRIFGIPIGLARSECVGRHVRSHPCHQAGGTGGILFPRPCAPQFVPSGLPGWVGVWRSFRPCSVQVSLFGPSCLSSTRRWVCCGAASRLLALRREFGSPCFILSTIASDRISGSAIGLVHCEGVCSSPAEAAAICCPCFLVCHLARRPGIDRRPAMRQALDCARPSL